MMDCPDMNSNGIKLISVVSLVVFLLLVPFTRFAQTSDCSKFEFMGNSPGDWSNVDIGDFPQRLIILLDSAGNVAGRKGDTARKARLKYWKKIFGGSIQKWMDELNQKGAIQLDIEKSSAHFLAHGFTKNGGSWKDDFLYFPAQKYRSLPPFEQIYRFGDIFMGDNSYRKNWGLASAGKPMALSKVAECISEYRNRNNTETLSRSLYILKITDNYNNRDRNHSELNEIKAAEGILTKSNEHLTGFDYLWKRVDESSKHYDYIKSEYALFDEHGKKSYTTDIKKIFAEPCRGGECPNPLVGSIAEVKPSVLPNPYEFFTPKESFEFKVSANGYHADLIYTATRIEKGPYTLKNIAVSFPYRDAKINRQKISQKNERIVFSLKTNQNKHNRTFEPIEVSSVYRYNPPGFDLGLLVEQKQTLNIPFQPFPRLSNGKYLDHKIMAANHGKSQKEILIHYERKALIKKFIQIAMVILSVLLIVFFIYKVLDRYRKPKFKSYASIFNSLARKGGKEEEGEDNARQDQNKENPRLREINIDLKNFLTEPEIVIGNFFIENSAQANFFGRHERLNLNVDVRVENIEPDCNTDPGLLLLGNDIRYADFPITGHGQWPVIIDAKNFDGIKQIDIPTEYLKIQGIITCNYRRERKRKYEKQKTEVRFTVPVHVEPVDYEFKPVIKLNSETKKEIEFNAEKEDVHLGYFILEDTTPARHRQPANLKILGAIYVNNRGQKSVCNDLAFYLELNGSEGLPERKERKTSNLGIDINELIYGNVEISLKLKMKHIDPVYQRTKFVIELIVDNGDYSVRKTEPFYIFENQEESKLIVRYRNCLKRPSKWSEYVSGEMLDLRNDKPVIQDDSISEEILNFEIYNSANHPNAEKSPTNVIYIKRIRLNNRTRDAAYRFTGEHNNERLPLGSDGLLNLALEPRKDDNINIRIDINKKNTGSDFFEKGQHSAIIEIEYDLFDEEEAKNVAATLSIPFSFNVKPDLGKEVVAVDFGTSAIAAAHLMNRSDNDSINEVIPMGDLWKKFYNPKGDVPRENDGDLISSILYLDKEKQLTLSPATLGEVNKEGDHFIQFLKTYIGGCKKEYPLNDGTSYSVKDAVKFAYKTLSKDYFLKHRNGKIYKRIVITHPNSYMDGQIEYLAETIKLAIPKVNEVQSISESDAVIYQYVKKYYESKREFKKGEKENILSFDMGAGTVDLSFRSIPHNVDGHGNSGPDLFSESKSELLGMVSVNGAGNLLDECIAIMVDKETKFIKNAFDSLKEKDSILTPIIVYSCFKSDSEEKNEIRQQKRALQELLRAIQDSKVGLACDTDKLIIKLPVSDDLRMLTFMAFSRNSYNFLKSRLKEKNKFEYADDGNVFLNIPMQDVQNYLKETFYQEQIIEPLDAILKGDGGEFEQVHTLLITGRGALFPGIQEEIIKHVTEHNSGLSPNVIETFKEPGKMKKVVAEGALTWGVDAIAGESLFETPFLHGTIGIAYLSYGKWAWHPLIKGRQFDDKADFLEPVWCDFVLTPNSCQIIMVMLTTINSSELVQKELDHIEYENITALKQRMEQSGYFRQLYFNSNPISLRKHGVVKFGVRPITLANNPEIYQNEGFNNMRVEVIIQSGISDDDCEGQEIVLQEKETLASRPLTYHDTWPDKIFKTGGV